MGRLNDIKRQAIPQRSMADLWHKNSTAHRLIHIDFLVLWLDHRFSVSQDPGKTRAIAIRVFVTQRLKILGDLGLLFETDFLVNVSFCC